MSLYRMAISSRTLSRMAENCCATLDVFLASPKPESMGVQILFWNQTVSDPPRPQIFPHGFQHGLQLGQRVKCYVI